MITRPWLFLILAQSEHERDEYCFIQFSFSLVPRNPYESFGECIEIKINSLGCISIAKVRHGDLLPNQSHAKLMEEYQLRSFWRTQFSVDPLHVSVYGAIHEPSCIPIFHVQKVGEFLFPKVIGGYGDWRCHSVSFAKNSNRRPHFTFKTKEHFMQSLFARERNIFFSR